MLWVRDELVADRALSVSVLDRTFEHGLGLFETFRTWNGRPALLDRHLERLRRSARALGLPLEPGQLPDAQAVALLIAASRDVIPSGQDARVRITLSGGMATAPSSGSVLWMTVGAVPTPHDESGVVISKSIQVPEDDPLARHKTLNYWRRRIAHASAIETGSDEILCMTHDGRICETSRSNIFLVERGRLSTPSLDGPLLPGVMRGVVMEVARQTGLETEEGSLPVARIKGAGEAFLTNSVRGIVPIARLLGVELSAPGRATRQLWDHILAGLVSADSWRT